MANSGSDGGRVRPPPAPAPRRTGPDLVDDVDREAFLEILSHELRTPVTTIYGGARVLADNDLTPDRRRSLAADVSEEADRLYRVVEDLVILVRSERGGIRPVGEPVAIGRLVLAAVARETGQHPDARITVSGERDTAADGADEVMVNHVIRNLLDNAVRYGGDGPIEVLLETAPGEVRVRVIDRGDPPEPDDEPFASWSRRPATAVRRAGAGIGLYVADRLVRAMGGRTWARRADRSGADRSGAEYGFSLARTTTP
ncbi:MAG: HAMP domain-containing sensor histidine kinase [Chloroflexota bacterium]